MTKKNLREALKVSMKSEEKAINDRFAVAETVFEKKEAKPTVENNEKEKFPKKARKIREKVIRDSFTMPKMDYDLIGTLKKRSLKAGIEVTKSEIIRLGLKTLNEMNDNDFVSKVNKIEKVKTGRPKQV